jgi:uncharacterized protein (DUF2164 family)
MYTDPAILSLEKALFRRYEEQKEEMIDEVVEMARKELEERVRDLAAEFTIDIANVFQAEEMSNAVTVRLKNATVSSKGGTND